MIPEAPWEVRHIDAGGDLALAATSANAVLAVFWLDAMPIGLHVYTAGELPAPQTPTRALVAAFQARALACRVPDIAGPFEATGDGAAIEWAKLEPARTLRAPLDELRRIANEPLPSARAVSVVVCTRRRSASLRRCLESLARQDAAPGQVIVVDNDPADLATREVVDGFPFCAYAPEPRRGLSGARNAGVSIASGSIVAFTDDDVEVHPRWAGEIARAFEGAPREVESVTGLVLPAALDTPAQVAFQFEFGGLCSRTGRVVFDRAFTERTRPFGTPVWRIGAGANMAFRREALRRLGPFDERLGAGAAGCSEDSEMWYRILASGNSCLYEPRAVVYHHHRESWRELKSQMGTYMRGHAAALAVQARNHGDQGNIRRLALQLPVYYARLATRTRLGARRKVLLQEISGYLAGTWLAACLLREPPRRYDNKRASP